MGKPQQAMEEYQKVLSLKPEDAKALYGLGQVLGTLGDSEKSIETLKKAVKLHPEFAQARSLMAAEYNRQGAAFMAQGDLEAAKAAFEAGIGAKGGTAQTEALRNNLGCLYIRENRLDQAIETFRGIISQNPNVPQAHYNLALIYYANGDYQAASRQMFALKGIDRQMAGELSDYRFRVEGAPNYPVKTMLTFPGSRLLTEGSIPPEFK